MVRALALSPSFTSLCGPYVGHELTRCLRTQEDSDSFRNKRGPRAPRARQDLEMTASGPMAQGPGGPRASTPSLCSTRRPRCRLADLSLLPSLPSSFSPLALSLGRPLPSLTFSSTTARAWGAGRPAGAGASGAAVMAASRAGTLNRMLDDDSDASDLEGGGGYGSDAPGGGGSGDEGAHVRRFKAVDLNDIGAEPGGGARDGEDEAVTPLTLPRDPKVLRTKIRRLQERKAERAKREGASCLLSPARSDLSLFSAARRTDSPSSLARAQLDTQPRRKASSSPSRPTTPSPPRPRPRPLRRPSAARPRPRRRASHRARRRA